MLKELLAEAAEIETKLRAGTEFPDYTTAPVADGEMIVGIITDPWLKALFMAYRARAEAMAQQPLPAMETLLGDGGGDILMMIREAEQKLDEMLRKQGEISFLSQILWTEAALAFGMSPKSDIGIRAGWTVITASERRDRRHGDRREQEAEGCGEPEEPEIQLSDLDCNSCTKTSCPIHPYHSVASPVTSDLVS